jgi:ankyrin repeat protein
MNKLIKFAYISILATTAIHAMDRKRSHAEEMWPTTECLTTRDLAELKKARADDYKENFGEFLIAAATSGNVQAVADFLWRGTSVNYRSSVDSSTALMYAAASGQFACAEQLLNAGADITAINDQGRTALYYASKSGNHDLETLLQAHLNGASDPEVFNQEDLSQKLNQAAKKGNVSLVKELLKKGAPLNNGALIEAAKFGQLACVEELIAANAQVDYTDSKNNTALILAATKNHAPCVLALVAAEANIHHKNNDNRTALRLATKNRCFKAEYALRKTIEAARYRNK